VRIVAASSLLACIVLGAFLLLACIVAAAPARVAPSLGLFSFDVLAPKGSFGCKSVVASAFNAEIFRVVASPARARIRERGLRSKLPPRPLFLGQASGPLS